MRSFGSILYDDRIIITFGGICGISGKMDNIYYLNLYDNNGWKESKIKCLKSGACHALLLNNNIVHIFPYYDYKDYFSIITYASN